MTNDSFDRSLQLSLEEFSPEQLQLTRETPWERAMTLVIWGLALCQITFQMLLLQYILAMAAAYFGSTFAISVMRSLAVRTGYAGFAFYCWGMALISMILYLTT